MRSSIALVGNVGLADDGRHRGQRIARVLESRRHVLAGDASDAQAIVIWMPPAASQAAVEEQSVAANATIALENRPDARTN